MKYIDAEKLRAEIEKRAKFHDDAIKACTGLNNIAITHSAGWKEDTELIALINSLQQEQPMPDSTKLIELWHEDKEMLKEKDFRDDPWRLAYNAFMCGFGRGIAVNKQEQPQVADASKMEQPESGCSEKPNDLREQPEVDLEKLGEIARHIIAVKQNVEDMRLSEDEWSLLERFGYPQKLNARKK